MTRIKNILFIGILSWLVSFQVMASQDFLKNSLGVGDQVPDFTLVNAFGQQVNLYKELEEGPVVLSFYRGNWCPFCNIQLHSYQQKLSEIEGMGAQLIAVSPETPTNAEVMIMKNELKFEVLSDRGSKVAEMFGILWEVPESEKKSFASWMLSKTGHSLDQHNGVPGYKLPVPATYVINKDKKILFAYKNVNYKERADIEEILAILRAIK